MKTTPAHPAGISFAARLLAPYRPVSGISHTGTARLDPLPLPSGKIEALTRESDVQKEDWQGEGHEWEEQQ